LWVQTPALDTGWCKGLLALTMEKYEIKEAKTGTPKKDLKNVLLLDRIFCDPINHVSLFSKLNSIFFSTIDLITFHKRKLTVIAAFNLFHSLSL
jgi:hypothetical protein